MEHTDAVRTNAVERYLLDEMNEEERAIFEEHFFECGHCVAAINAGTQLMIAGKAVALEDKRAAEPQAGEKPIGNIIPFWKRYRAFPQAAAATLLLAVGALLGRIPVRVPPGPVAIDALHPYGGVGKIAVELGKFRAEEAAPAVYQIPSGGSLLFLVDPDDRALSYVAQIRDGCGKSFGTETISREEAAGPVSKRLGELPAGRYVLVIEGVLRDGKRFEISRGDIEVEKVGER